MKQLEIIADGQPLEYSTLEFSGGEVQVRITDQLKYPYSVIIRAHIINSSGLMELLLMTDALRRVGAKKISLVIPYLPYARQDRVCAPGESLSLKVFCDIINSQSYESVEVWDVHSDVSLALLDRVINRHQSEFVSKLPVKESNCRYLVAPDAGALKKINQVSDITHYPVVRADKTRAPFTGEITETIVYAKHLGLSDVLIVDDICDGGYTFLQLAKALRHKTYGKINLYVTHGIFSKGLDIFEGVINKIYCPNVFPNVKDHPLLERMT